jgi:hypothetical protein
MGDYEKRNEAMCAKDRTVPRETSGLVTGGMAAEARQSAKGVIRDRIRMLRHEADQLEALAQSLPEVLPREADAALWNLAIRGR